ncbi:MAG: ABC transporter permease [Clostridiaceae bacterium]|nr:ABC transporter permease [Clostridiaceae bacterium]
MAEKVLKKIGIKTTSGKTRELGMIGFIIVISIFVQMRNPNFLTLENINDLVKNTAILSILAVGMMLVMITKGIDLSIGATLALAGMSASLMVSNNPSMSPIIAIGIGIAVGTLCGAVVGGLVSKGGIYPIIATLGMMNVYRGLTFKASGGKWVSAQQMSASFKGIATGSILGINNLIFIAIIIYIISYYFINHTRTGRKIYAVGSNPESAEVSGINNKRILFMVYTIMGALAGLAGVLWVSKFASAQGDTASGYELSVIAACVLGGVSSSGGSGTISGILIGSLLLGILNNALPLINVSTFWQNAIQGSIILIAIIVNTIVKRRVDKTNLSRRKI